MRRTTRYIAVFSALLLGLMAITATINIAGDPYYHLFWRSRERDAFAARYAKALVASPYGLVYVEQDRPIKRALLSARPAECYVFGSSEGMGVSTSNFPPLRRDCGSFTNLGATLGGFEDTIAFAGMLAQQHTAKRFYVVLSPWFLRAKANSRWTQLTDEVLRGTALLDPAADLRTLGDIAHVKIEAVSEALSLYYLPASIRALRRGEDLTFKIVPLVARDQPSTPADAITHRDGSHVFAPAWVAARHTEAIEHATADRAASSKEMLGRWTTIIDALRRYGIETIFVLPPYHPELWRCEPPSVCKAFNDLEAEIIALAQRRHVLIYGSYDPRKLGLTAADFIDLNHIDPIHFDAVAGLER